MTKPWIVERMPEADSESLGAVYDLYVDGEVPIPVGRFLDTLAKFDPETETASSEAAPLVNLIAQMPVMLGMLHTLAARKTDLGYRTDGLMADVDEARAFLHTLRLLEPR